ncbi:signal peptidase I [Plantactinospora sp. DSM 117369]
MSRTGLTAMFRVVMARLSRKSGFFWLVWGAVPLCLGGLLGGLAGVFATTQFSYVAGPAMEPALRSGDHLVVDAASPVRPGDLVVVRYTADSRDWLIISRLIAEAGDQVTCDGQQRVRVNGVVVRDSAGGPPSAERDPDAAYIAQSCLGFSVPYPLPEGMVVLLDDGRGLLRATGAEGVVGRAFMVVDPRWKPRFPGTPDAFRDPKLARADRRIPAPTIWAAVAAAGLSGLLGVAVTGAVRSVRRRHRASEQVGDPSGRRRTRWPRLLRLRTYARRGWTFRLVLVAAALCLGGLVGTPLTGSYAELDGLEENMAPTLRPGDRILADRVSSPRRGDVVLIRASAIRAALGGRLSGSQAARPSHVMRVIALPGDRVSCCDERQRLDINGWPFHERYVTASAAERAPRNVVVPADRVLVASDNGRELLLVAADGISGRVFAVLADEARPQFVGTPNAYQAAGLAPRGERIATPVVLACLTMIGIVGLLALGAIVLVRRARRWLRAVAAEAATATATPAAGGPSEAPARPNRSRASQTARRPG